MAIKEMVNNVVIEGILSEIGLERSSYTKDGKTFDCIRGEVKVKVIMPVEKGGEEKELEIPVRYFVKKYTNAGNENPAYTNLAEIIDNGKSIATVGIESANRVRITGGSASMQEYYTPDGRFISFPVVKASFINIIKDSDMEYKAKAEVEVIVQNKKMLTNKDGIETGDMVITGITIGYGGYADVIPFKTSNGAYIAAINATYSEGDIMRVVSCLNFSSTTEKTYEEVAIGDPIERTRTVNVSDLVIASIAPASIVAEDIEKADLTECLNKRTARLEDAKQKAAKKKTAERDKGADKAKMNLGF